MASQTPNRPATLTWTGDAANGHLLLLDQTRLPLDVTQRDCRQLQDVVEAISVKISCGTDRETRSIIRIDAVEPKAVASIKSRQVD